MTNRNADKISTLVDDELAGWEMTPVVQSLRHDPEMQACWRNYHLIGEAMRGSLPKYVCIDLTERVRDALEHEPVFIHPQSSPPPAVHGTHTRTKATVGFALAASMSAIAVFGVVGIDRDAGMPSPSAPMATAGATLPVPAAEAEPVLASLLAELDAAETRADGAQQQQQWIRIQTVSSRPGALPGSSNLSEYLMNYHQQQAMPAGRDDPLSYLRVVSHGSQ